MPCKQ